MYLWRQANSHVSPRSREKAGTKRHFSIGSLHHSVADTSLADDRFKYFGKWISFECVKLTSLPKVLQPAAERFAQRHPADQVDNHICGEFALLLIRP
jgi:hypothetical protein